MSSIRLLSFPLVATILLAAHAAPAAEGWSELFDGKSLVGWTAAEHPDTWKVADGCLVARGPRSHLFYEGPTGNHDFRNFELVVEARPEAAANSGVFFHTQYQETGWPAKGYEVQINNTFSGSGTYRELKRTGSLYAVRDIAPCSTKDGEWLRLTIRVVGNRVRIHVNDYLMVDYLQPEQPAQARPGRTRPFARDDRLARPRREERRGVPPRGHPLVAR